MTCGICKFYDVCVIRNTLEACTHQNLDDFAWLLFGKNSVLNAMPQKPQKKSGST